MLSIFFYFLGLRKVAVLLVNMVYVCVLCKCAVREEECVRIREMYECLPGTWKPSPSQQKLCELRINS